MRWAKSVAPCYAGSVSECADLVLCLCLCLLEVWGPGSRIKGTLREGGQERETRRGEARRLTARVGKSTPMACCLSASTGYRGLKL